MVCVACPQEWERQHCRVAVKWSLKSACGRLVCLDRWCWVRGTDGLRNGRHAFAVSVGMPVSGARCSGAERTWWKHGPRLGGSHSVGERLPGGLGFDSICPVIAGREQDLHQTRCVATCPSGCGLPAALCVFVILRGQDFLRNKSLSNRNVHSYSACH